MAIDSTWSQWANLWAIWGWAGLALLIAFLVLEFTAVATHGWTLSNVIATYTHSNPWTLYVYIAAVVVFGVHIWVFGGK
jgi:hypothetical protein